MLRQQGRCPLHRISGRHVTLLRRNIRRHYVQLIRGVTMDEYRVSHGILLRHGRLQPGYLHRNVRSRWSNPRRLPGNSKRSWHGPRRQNRLPRRLYRGVARQLRTSRRHAHDQILLYGRRQTVRMPSRFPPNDHLIVVRRQGLTRRLMPWRNGSPGPGSPRRSKCLLRNPNPQARRRYWLLQSSRSHHKRQVNLKIRGIRTTLRIRERIVTIRIRHVCLRQRRQRSRLLRLRRR